MPEKALYYGDNLPMLRDHIPTDSVDLVYLDPPFNSGRKFNVLFQERDAADSEAQIRAFEDYWTWDRAAERTYKELTDGRSRRARHTTEAHRPCGSRYEPSSGQTTCWPISS